MGYPRNLTAAGRGAVSQTLPVPNIKPHVMAARTQNLFCDIARRALLGSPTSSPGSSWHSPVSFRKRTTPMKSFPTDPNAVMRASELATMLDTTTETVLRACREGTIYHVRIGREYLIPREWVR